MSWGVPKGGRKEGTRGVKRDNSVVGLVARKRRGVYKGKKRKSREETSVLSTYLLRKKRWDLFCDKW